MAAVEHSETAKVLAEMLTENTGRHLLDSGGAYGRSWERNQTATADSDPIEYFKSLPEITVDKWGCITLDVFHFLNERVTFDAKLDRAWRKWVELEPVRSDNPRYYNGITTADDFEAQLAKKGWADTGRDFAGSWTNTYNNEDALSQTLQYKILYLADGCPLADNGEDYYALLSIHGGCDVRGGYTDLRAFWLNGWEGVTDLFDNARVEAYAEGIEPPQSETLFGSAPEVRHSWTSYTAGYSWDSCETPHGRDAVPEWNEDEERYQCSDCGCPVEIYPPFVS